MLDLTMRSALICTIFLALSFRDVAGAAVMSVDLGNEWMKVGVVSPGVPMEIVLNKESKRKTPAVVAFRDGARLFGEDAQSIGVRFPAQSYGYLMDLLGKKVDHPMVKLYQERFPYYRIEAEPARGTVVFRHDPDTAYSVEELVAQLLSKAREMARVSTGQPITECVLTVPGYFGQAERRALLQAAALADLKPLQLINDYTAVALNYGIFRRKEINDTSHYIMFYDMGAHKTTVTIVEYKIVKTKDRGYLESNPQLQVIGVGYDRTLGGLEMTLRLRDHLAAEFNAQKKTSSDITRNPRAMAKLFKEANRVKTVLSANNDHFAQVEGLIDEKDYRMQVTRAAFEGLCEDLMGRVVGPIDTALDNAGLTLDIMSQFILVGAGTRVPRVQDMLAKRLAGGSLELSKNINADEAATLGAAYRAADLSKGFKVKQFVTRDAVVFPIQVTFERSTADGSTGGSTASSTTKLAKRTLFGSMNPYPQKKVITFNKHQEDFTFNVQYADFKDHPGGSETLNMLLPPSDTVIQTVELKGITDHLRNMPDKSEPKGIKAHFEMDDSGVLRLLNVDFVIEKHLEEQEEEESTLSKLGSTISNLFSGNSDSGKDEKIETEDSTTSGGGGKEEEVKETEDTTGGKMKDSVNKTDEALNSTTKTNETVKNNTKVDNNKPKIVTVKEPVKMVEKSKLMLMSDDEFTSSYKKIERLNRVDEERAHRETALNHLESFVIEAQLRMDTEEYVECGVAEEIEKIKTTCSEVSEWLYEDGAEATADQYESKLNDLKKLTSGIYERHYEHNERPEALKALNSMLNGSSNFLQTAKNLTKDVNPDKDVFTPVEIETLERVINETRDWQTQQVEEQAKTKKNEPVKLTIKSLTEKMAALDREVKYLVNKIKIWKPKIVPTEKPVKEDQEPEVVVNSTNEETVIKSSKDFEDTSSSPDGSENILDETMVDEAGDSNASPDNKDKDDDGTINKKDSGDDSAASKKKKKKKQRLEDDLTKEAHEQDDHSEL